MKHSFTHEEESQEAITQRTSSMLQDYIEIVKSYDVPWTVNSYYIQIGEITKVQGWILHISVVISQVSDLLQQIVPLLLAEKVAFKIPLDKETAENLLMGNLGTAQIGKIVCIYPEDNVNALMLAQKLVALTQSYKGPVVPTDVCLGNIVYTRYGSFKPVVQRNDDGTEENYIYDVTGKLVKDTYAIPFKIPAGVPWPFLELSSPVVPPPKSVLHHIYKPLRVLKNDVKGNVYKGLYMKGLFRVRPCIIKQGAKNMISEDNGRDMHDRLVWQQQLYHKLADTIPLPEVFDLFVEEDGHTYLVMEYIAGSSLHDQRIKINPEVVHWARLSANKALQLLSYIIEIVSIIDRMHERGYVHRDIAPGNFIINKHNKIYLIDIELTYSLNEKKPNPPFVFGTPGFMSPEQQAVLEPTVKEDVYGLGALMLTIFTGITPNRIDTRTPESLYNNLYFFIENADLTGIITACLHPDPTRRPTLKEIQQVLDHCGEHLRATFSDLASKPHIGKTEQTSLERIIQASLNGLNKAPIITLDDIWYSETIKPKNFSSVQNKEYSRYPGMYQGLGGVLYFLARAHRAGFNINTCISGYKKSWVFIEENYLNQLSNMPPGLYNGAAGLALAIAEGITAGLRPNDISTREQILQCLTLPNIGLDLANGITGQCIAMLQCASYLDNIAAQTFLQNCLNILLDTQLKDGSWTFPATVEKTKDLKKVGLGYGISGITWFLLDYIAYYPQSKVKEASLKALRWLLQSTGDLKKLFRHEGFEKKMQEEGVGDERKGIILVFIKAYEVLHDEYYREIAEKALRQYPSYQVKIDFNQEAGLSGMGELYLEAFRVFNNPEWKQRADWIAELYLHTFFEEPVAHGYWKMEEFNDPTSDFMIGISGIIHFLIRCLEPSKLGYRLLR